MEPFGRELAAALDTRLPGFLGLHVGIGLPSPADKLPAEHILNDLVATMRGAVSAERGIGLAKRNWLHHSRSEAEIAAMGAIKKTLDPRGILNPGKVLPSSRHPIP